MAETIDGRRGGKVLVHSGYIYHKNKISGDLIYWRCSSKDCRAPLKTNAFDIEDPPDAIDVFDMAEHNHVPSDEIIAKHQLVNDMKQNVRNDPSAPLRRVYDQTVVAARRQNNAPTVEEIPLFHEVTSRLKRTKYSIIPPIPNNVEEVELNDVWRLTWNGDEHIV